MRRVAVWFCVAMAVGMMGSLPADAACPAGSLATDSQLLFVDGVGHVAVEVCVTRAGAVDTYTYRFTAMGAGTTSACSILLSGAGSLATLGISGPAGWLGMTDDASSPCAVWWTWTSTGGVGLAGPGGTLELTLEIEGETHPTRSPATIKTCDGTSTYFEILGPAACAGLASAGSLGGCDCLPGGCSAEAAFEGAGTRILILGGPDLQRLGRCDASWIRHGWSGGEGFDPDAVAFRLFIDGIPMALDRQVLCGPSHTAGRANLAAYGFVEFPPDMFTVGVHEVTGEWVSGPTAEDPAGYTFSRTIRLLVEECIPEPIPLSGPPYGPLEPLDPGDSDKKGECPDLIVDSVEASCECAWNQQQQYVCRVEFEIAVDNLGDADAGTFRVKVGTSEGDIAKTVTSLAAGGRRIVKTSLSFEGEACPLVYSILVDAYDEVAECNEENNTFEEKVCCE